MAAVKYRSLRDWIEFLEKQGDLVRNKEEVDIWGEISTISYKIGQTDGPAVLHENIKGYPGWRVFSDGLTTRRRQLWALDLPPEESLQAIIERMAKAKPIKPVVLDNAPCKEIKLFGDDIDLVKLPIAFSSDLEITPHLTAGICFIRDPETGWINAGIRRLQLVGKNKLLNLVLPYSHEGQIFMKYKRLRKPAPLAISIGYDPVTCFCSIFPAPLQFDEMDYFGLFTGEPLEVAKCETSDLTVPATSEIVIEGEMNPDEVELEGPFPEMPGYYSGFRMCPTIKAKAITMRSDPIYQFMYMGLPPSEGHNAGNFPIEIELLRQLKTIVPEVTDVAVLSTQSLTTAVSINRRMMRPGLDKKVAMAVKAIEPGRLVKNLFIVDDYVNLRNIHEILWSLSVKFQPAKDFLMIPETVGLLLDPSETVIGPGFGYSRLSSYGVFNCLEKLPPYDEGFRRGLATPPKESQQRVEEKWSKYGFK